MLGALPIANSVFKDVTSNGSPFLLRSVGRAFGLADAEQNALVSGKMPTWFWIAAGLTVGVVAGIQVHKRWAHRIPRALGGS